MAKFLLTYHGGGMAETEEAQAAAMQAWMGWFSDLGEAVLDVGNPAGAAKTIGTDGSVSDGGGANPVSGYSTIEASDLDDAVSKAKGCPVIASGGTVEVSETFEV